MKSRITGFLRFWYEFIVGDDWSFAVAVVAALALTYAISKTTFPAWLVLPAVVAVTLCVSLWRVAHRRPSRADDTD